MGSTEGGVLIEWQTEEVDLILEIESSGEFITASLCEVVRRVVEHAPSPICAASE